MKKSWKKSRGILAAACLIMGTSFGLFGCTGDSGSPTSASSQESSSQETTAEQIEETSENKEDTLKEEQEGDKEPDYDSLTAIEFSRLMGNGINLGNTMEAYGHKELGTNAPVSKYETFWKQPVTTKEMILAMKKGGFDSLRIPVAWTNTMDFEEGDYTIKKPYLDRVDELIQYALDSNMYVIINDHWDGGWWGMFGSENPDIREKAMEMYKSIWSQLADRYGDYSSKLIFESGNEELGDRLNDKDWCSDSGSLSEDECYETANKINQTFVDLIRSSGKKNENRFLLIAGYNTDIVKTCDDRFIMPKDTAKDKLLVSVHYYVPWGYCGTVSITRWGTKKNYQEQENLLEKMTKFTEAGYGVVIGEYAVALDNEGLVKDNTKDFIENFLNHCDVNDFCPILWDCNDLFVRKYLTFLDKDIAEEYQSRNVKTQSSLSLEEIQTQAKKELNEAFAAAPDQFESDVDLSSLDGALAWIMFRSGDGKAEYSAGDAFDPDSKTKGLIAENTEISGEGSYEVSLDFTELAEGESNGITFAALGISNGEQLYPDYVVEIEEILINGESYPLKAQPYTSSDDEHCTRVNLYNAWAEYLTEGTRTVDIEGLEPSPIILDESAFDHLKTLKIRFNYIS